MIFKECSYISALQDFFLISSMHHLGNYIYFHRILIEQGGLKIDEMVDSSGMTTIHIAAVNQKASRLDYLISKVRAASCASEL